MFEAGDIREWRGYDVVDPDGHKIGELEAGLRRHEYGSASVRHCQGRHAYPAPARVPLARATVGPGCLKVAHDKKHVKGSPSISTDGELPAAGEEAIFKHYGLAYQPGAGGERQLARR